MAGPTLGRPRPWQASPLAGPRFAPGGEEEVASTRFGFLHAPAIPSSLPPFLPFVGRLLGVCLQVGRHPNHVILLTCDGYGVLPPVSKLTKAQVIYHFIQGYTSKMAGTEEGITKPVAAFSACYGEPFLVWHPVKYATMLAEKLTQHDATAWLLNTGWVGGAKGKRCPLKYTRAIVDAIHSGALAKAEYKSDSVFRLSYPTSCPSVPSDILDPSSSWADKKEFEATRNELAGLFAKNFDKYKDKVTADVIAQGPVAPPFPVA